MPKRFALHASRITHHAAGALPPQMMGLIGAGAGAVLLGLLLVGSLSHGQRLSQQLTITQQQVTQLEGQNRELVQQYDSLKSERSSLEEKIASVRTQLSSVNGELERSQASLKDIRVKYDVLSEERTLLQAQVATLTTNRDQYRGRTERLEGEKTELERKAVRTRERLTLLDRDYRKLQEKVARLEQQPHPGVDVVTSIDSRAGVTTGQPPQVPPTSGSAVPGAVELPPIVVRKDQAGMIHAVRGRLLEVNIPHRFVVVDQGSEDGVRVGTAFDIMRGSAVVGRATAVRVHSNLSACDVVTAKTPGPLQIGDLAVQSGR
jgi:hypothetical protein